MGGILSTFQPYFKPILCCTFNFLIVCGRAIKQGRSQHFRLRSKIEQIHNKLKCMVFSKVKGTYFLLYGSRELFWPVAPLDNNNPKFQGRHINKNIDHHQISLPHDSTMPSALHFCLLALLFSPNRKRSYWKKINKKSVYS